MTVSVVRELIPSVVSSSAPYMVSSLHRCVEMIEWLPSILHSQQGNRSCILTQTVSRAAQTQKGLIDLRQGRRGAYTSWLLEEEAIHASPSF